MSKLRSTRKQMLKGDYEKTRMVLQWKMKFFENRPLERVPNYSKLLLSVETDYQTTLGFARYSDKNRCKHKNEH